MLGASAGQPTAQAVEVSGDRLRQAIGHFPTGVGVVTSIDAAGEPVGTTAKFAARGFGAAWDTLGHHRGVTGCPRFHDVLAVVDCTVEHRLPGGDHEIVVGRVIDLEISDEEHPPLIYYRGAYVCLGQM
jgi:flavin reductase (DIM6/NTAB) family NADH-FMN oxidoreductase RutF